MPEFSLKITHFINELDAAVEAHMDWTRRMLRCAVLRVSPGEDSLSPQAHTLCHFGCWFEKNKIHFEYLNAQNTHMLESVHKTMHDSVRTICSELLAGTPVDEHCLDTFEQTQIQLIDLMAKFKTLFLARAARQDPLTGLPLRYGIESEFKLMQKLCKRHHIQLYLMLLDIDHFKRVNDTYGHPIGDIALRHLADLLKYIKRDNEPLYRFGGEEFLLLLQSKSHLEAKEAAQRFIETIANTPVVIPDHPSLTMTVTLGLTHVSNDEEFASALERADKALYEGKHAGRNRYVFSLDASQSDLSPGKVDT